jgi:hypothetical protein
LAHVVLLCFLLTTIADQIRISWANSDILNIIADALVEEGVDRSTFGFSPFPIEMPDRLPDFLPTSVVCYTTVCEPRNEQKIERLRNLRYTVIVLYREQPKKISGSVIREDIVVGGEVWKTMVPNATVRAIAELDLRNRQKILRSSGIDSKL